MMQRHLVESREVTLTNRSELDQSIRTDFSVHYLDGCLSELTLYPDGTMSFGSETLKYSEAVHEDLVKAAGIPVRFEESLRFSTMNKLFEDLKRERSQGITLCISNDTVVGIAKAQYDERVARTSDVLDQLPEDSEDLAFEIATVSDCGVKIDFLIPGVQVEPDAGDIVKVGLEVSNSETGGESLKAHLWTLRQVCSNGMTVRTDDTTVYFSQSKKQSYASGIRRFVREVVASVRAAEVQARNLYQSVSDQAMLDTELVSLIRTLQRRVGRKLDVNEIIGIDPEERTEIQTRVRTRDPGQFPLATRFQTWQVHNRITAAARSEQLLLRQSLEELGGKILVSAQKRRHRPHGNRFLLN